MHKYKVEILPDDPAKEKQTFFREGSRRDVHKSAVRQACHVFGEQPNGLPRATVVSQRVLVKKHDPPPAEGVLVRGERIREPFKNGIKMPDGRVL